MYAVLAGMTYQTKFDFCYTPGRAQGGCRENSGLDIAFLDSTLRSGLQCAMCHVHLLCKGLELACCFQSCTVKMHMTLFMLAEWLQHAASCP